MPDRRTGNSLPCSTINRGIALLPNEDYTRRFIELQRRTSDFLDLVPKFSVEGNVPHLTVVQGTFPSRMDFSSLMSAAHRNLPTTGHLTLYPTQFVYKPVGWIFLEVRKDQGIDTVHRAVADVAASHLVAPSAESGKTSSYTPEEISNYEKYGYRYMYDQFYPHITLGRLNREPTPHEIERVTAIARELDLFTPCSVYALSTYEMGSNGAHARAVMVEHLVPVV
jgi:hypothetical protein